MFRILFRWVSLIFALLSVSEVMLCQVSSNNSIDENALLTKSECNFAYLLNSKPYQYLNNGRSASFAELGFDCTDKFLIFPNSELVEWPDRVFVLQLNTQAELVAIGSLDMTKEPFEKKLRVYNFSGDFISEIELPPETFQTHLLDDKRLLYYANYIEPAKQSIGSMLKIIDPNDHSVQEVFSDGKLITALRFSPNMESVGYLLCDSEQWAHNADLIRLRNSVVKLNLNENEIEFDVPLNGLESRNASLEFFEGSMILKSHPNSEANFKECWDRNNNNLCDSEEDSNGDGSCDCEGVEYIEYVTYTTKWLISETGKKKIK